VDCSSSTAKALERGYRIHGNVCDGKRGAVFHTTTKGFLDVKDQGEVFWFQDQKVTRIQILIPNQDWEKVKYDLTEKLGPPSSEMPQVFQNAFGARWEFEQGFWRKGDLVAYAEIKVLPGVQKVFGNGPATRGIEVTITDAAHAKLPETTANSLD